MIIDHDHDENEKIMNDDDHQIIHWMGVLTWTHEYVYDDDDEDDDDDDGDDNYAVSDLISWSPIENFDPCRTGEVLPRDKRPFFQETVSICLWCLWLALHQLYLSYLYC